MPFHVKSISISIAVLFFFIISVIGWFAGLAPFICCKRAMIGAVVTYIAASFAVKLINRILIEAMVQAKLNQQNGDAGAGRN